MFLVLPSRPDSVVPSRILSQRVCYLCKVVDDGVKSKGVGVGEWKLF